MHLDGGKDIWKEVSREGFFDYINKNHSLTMQQPHKNIPAFSYHDRLGNILAYSNNEPYVQGYWVKNK